MELLNRNSLPVGLIIGLLFPIFGFSLVYGIFDLMVSSGLMDEADTSFSSKRMRTMMLIGICTNIYWIRRFNQPFFTRTLRGVVIGTMLLCIVWFVLYYNDLYLIE